MKNDKVCVSSKLMMLVGFAVVVLMLVVGLQFINKDAKTTSSRASAPSQPLQRLSGGEGQACGLNDFCNEGLKCYNTKFITYYDNVNTLTKSCRKLESVCNTGVNSPCCAVASKSAEIANGCGSDQKCVKGNEVNGKPVTNSDRSYQSDLAAYLSNTSEQGWLISIGNVNPWGTGLCVPTQAKCGELNTDCCGNNGDLNRCDSSALQCGLWYLDGFPSYQKCMPTADLRVGFWGFASDKWTEAKANDTGVKQYHPEFYYETNAATARVTIELNCPNKKITINKDVSDFKYNNIAGVETYNLNSCLFEAGKEYTVTGTLTILSNNGGEKIVLPLKAKNITIDPTTLKSNWD